MPVNIAQAVLTREPREHLSLADLPSLPSRPDFLAPSAAANHHLSPPRSTSPHPLPVTSVCKTAAARITVAVVHPSRQHLAATPSGRASSRRQVGLPHGAWKASTREICPRLVAQPPLEFRLGAMVNMWWWLQLAATISSPPLLPEGHLGMVAGDSPSARREAFSLAGRRRILPARFDFSLLNLNIFIFLSVRGFVLA